MGAKGGRCRTHRLAMLAHRSRRPRLVLAHPKAEDVSDQDRGEADELAQRSTGEVAILVVDRLDASSIGGEQHAAVKVEPSTQQHELTKHGAERPAIVASKVGDGLEVGPEAAQKPDDLDVAMGFALQPPAPSDPVP
jgi:hypothetical protein